MRGKVVLITGASSGIGEELAYEYAKKGASLVIVARRENQLQKVAEKARRLGSPEVLALCADVSNVDDLDHLVNNAGIASVSSIEDIPDITKLVPVMDVNFWGNVYPTYFAIPHLKKTKGKIVINSSVTAMLHLPRSSFYTASKAALIGFYETLRSELAPSILITIVTPGVIDTEITQGKYLSKDGVIKVNRDFIKNVVVQGLPPMSSRTCANTIVDAVCRGEKYVTVPKWYKAFFMLKALCPELVDWYNRTFNFKPTITHMDALGHMGSTLPPQNKVD